MLSKFVYIEYYIPHLEAFESMFVLLFISSHLFIFLAPLGSPWLMGVH